MKVYGIHVRTDTCIFDVIYSWWNSCSIYKRIILFVVNATCFGLCWLCYL